MHIYVKGVELTQTNWTTQLVPAQLERDELLDILGDLNRARKWLDKVEGFVKEALPSKFDTDEFEYATSRYMALRTQQTRVSLDGDKIKAEKLAELGEKDFEVWFKEHSKSTDFYQIKITEVKPK